MSACVRSVGLTSRPGPAAVDPLAIIGDRYARQRPFEAALSSIRALGARPEGLCRTRQQATDPSADTLHRFPVGGAEARQRGREDPVLLLVNVSAQECQRRGKPVRPGRVLWQAGRSFAEHLCNLLVLGLQDGYLVREIGRERGEQATFLDLGMRVKHGADPRGQLGHPRPIPLAPCYPDFADQAEHQIMLPGQFADRHQGLAAAILAHVASLGRCPASFSLCRPELAGEVGSKVTSYGRDRWQLRWTASYRSHVWQRRRVTPESVTRRDWKRPGPADERGGCRERT